ncbi:MAG: 1-acyl-sn-glycerol-3-phosphate acyltransferase [Bacilli bacterium]|nr:1-acyl-sn-glycerol-3-phosphate acyltransferase [Bacilli bacterium]
MKALKTFFKYFRLVFVIGFRILWLQLFFFRPKLKHKDEYTFEWRYEHLREFAVKIVRHMRPDFIVNDVSAFEGLDKPALVISNHQSIFDILAIMVACPHPIRFVCKQELKGKPFIGVWVDFMDGLYLNRDDVRQAVGVIKETTKTITEWNHSGAIFAEGTRNKDPFNVNLLEFHPGSFKPAYRAKCDILMVAQFGGFRPLGPGYNDRSCPVQMHVERLAYDSFKDLSTNELSDMIHQKMEKEIIRMRQVDIEYHKKKLHKKWPSKFWKDFHICERKEDEADQA